MPVGAKTTFALAFGNRGFFPASLIDGARRELVHALESQGYGCLVIDTSVIRYGAVETPEEGGKYARFLREHAGEFDGVILSLPNFGDENGAAEALKDAGVPILIQAYPDDLDKMDLSRRRDAFCGKLSVMDVFRQRGIPFTALKPHTVVPSTATFAAHLAHFAGVCRVVKGLRSMVVGAVGARTTPFKTVRIDEVALQRGGITVETFDLSDIFAQVRAVDANSAAYKAKACTLRDCSDWGGTPDKAFDNLVRLGVVLDRLVQETRLDALALRCWVEMQQQLGISPCVVMGEMNERRIPVACEVDVGNAVAMCALSNASANVAACLDWNNNYGDDDDKCILFHCGPVPRSMMAAKGRIEDHLIIGSTIGRGIGYGCNTGRIAPTPMTFASMTTDSGRLRWYAGQGDFTSDPVPREFFGCAGVARIGGLQDVLLHIGQEGFRHHVSVAPGHVVEPLTEALVRYLHFDVARPQAGR